jgi:3-methylcrotonyl-CoA carboxylase alpha subunit
VEIPVLADGDPITAEVCYGPAGPTVVVEGVAAALDAKAVEAADGVYVLRGGRQTVVRRADPGSGDLGNADGDATIKAPMHGKVLAIMVASGDQVTKGQRLAIIEAMKMEHTLTAPRAGRVGEIAVAPGAQVADGASLMTIESAEE